MDKLVYLYELDSVCNSKEEIIIGQQAMFEEIVKNGNVVVMTFNQLTDSQAFLYAIRDDKCYEQIMQLFHNGSIRISKYSDAKTASEYVQNSIESCLTDKKKNQNKKNKKTGNEYIFSGIPVLCKEKKLLRKLYRALRYSDLAILDEFAAKHPEEEDRIVYLKKYIKLILALSSVEDANISVKNNIYYHFPDYINIIISEKEYNFFPENKNLQTLYKQAIEILIKVKNSLSSEGVNKRSNWITELNCCEKSFEACMAEIIINLCYNYATEESVMGVSKHYDVRKKEQFLEDFGRRLFKYWKEYEKGIHKLQKGESNEITEYTVSLPKWETAVRITDARKKDGWDFRVKGAPLLYEKDYRKEKKCWKKKLRKVIMTNFRSALIYLGIFAVIDAGIGSLQDRLFKNIVQYLAPYSSIFINIVIALLTTILFGVIASKLEKWLGLPDFLESFQNAGRALKDKWIIFRTQKNKAYNALRKGMKDW